MTFTVWRWPLAFFVVAFSLSLVANLPAGILMRSLQNTGLDLSADQVAGTIWHGAASGARIGGLPAGTLTFNVSPLQLSPFGPQVTWSSAAVGIRSSGAAAVGLGGATSISDIEVSAQIDRFKLPVPVTGRFEATVASAWFDGRACRDAEGTVSLTGSVALPGRPPVRMSGPLLCDRGMVTTLLTGTIGPYPAVLDVISPSLETAELRLTVSDLPADVGVMFEALGFSENDGNYELGKTVRLQ